MHTIQQLDPEPISPYYPLELPKDNRIHRLIQFTNDESNYKFDTYTWPLLKDVKFKGRILIVHGFNESHQSYLSSSNFYNDNGFEVFYFTQRGQGLDESINPGQLGRTSNIRLQKDLNNLINFNLNELKERDNPTNLILYGFSMGGGIVLDYALNGSYKDDLRGVVTIAPLIKIHPISMPSSFIYYLIKYLVMFFPSTHRLTYHPKLNKEYSSNDPKWQDFIRRPGHDDTCGTLLQLYDMIKRGEDLTLFENYSKMNKNLPLIILHGSSDLVNYDKYSEMFIKNLIENCECENKFYVNYPGLRHNLNLNFESDTIKFRTDVLTFLNGIDY